MRCPEPAARARLLAGVQAHPPAPPPPAGVAPTPAKTSVQCADGSVAWVECTVVDHDAAANKYAVVIRKAALARTAAAPQGEPGAAEGAAEDAASAAGEVVRWVPRVALCFHAEDPFVFARRHADAHASRGRAESLLRYNLYIDCMPTEGIPLLSTEQVRRRRRARAWLAGAWGRHPRAQPLGTGRWAAAALGSHSPARAMAPPPAMLPPLHARAPRRSTACWALR